MNNIQNYSYERKNKEAIFKDKSAIQLSSSNQNKEYLRQRVFNKQSKQALSPQNKDKGTVYYQYKQKRQFMKPDYKKFVSQTSKNISLNEQKPYTPGYFSKYNNKDNQRKAFSPTGSGAQSQSKINSKNYESSYNFQKNNKKPKEKQTLKTNYSEYQKLHDKLSYLQVKISQMKNNLEKKRQEKKTFIENQQKQRIKRQQSTRRGSKQKNTDNVSNNSLKGLVTQMPQHKEYHGFNFNPYSPKHNRYYISQIVRAYKEDKSLARQHVQTSINILKILESSRVPSDQQIQSKKVYLDRRPGYQDKKTLVFDLDQTLIHCNQSLNVPYDVKVPIKFPTGQIIEAGINIRPHSVDLLRALSKNFEVIVFTASHSCYANIVLDHLDPDNKFVHHRLYRQHCVQTPEGMYVKDLRIINRDLSSMVLIDNAAYSYAYQLDNGIPIIPYYEGKVDYELKALQVYLEGLIISKDVREVNKKTFKMHHYVRYDEVQHLVEDLYRQWIV